MQSDWNHSMLPYWPYFVHGIQIWSCTSPSNLNILTVKQKAAIRIVNSSSYNSHTEPIFKSLNILPLANLIEYFKIQFMFNFINGELPISFESTWIKNENREGGDLHPLLRNHADIFIPPSRLTLTDKFPLFHFPRIWSSFPDNSIKNLTRIQSQAKSILPGQTFFHLHLQQITLPALPSEHLVVFVVDDESVFFYISYYSILYTYCRELFFLFVFMS